MVALHGREDPLLEAARFTRLLRQANDAEIADVRKVGEDDYEVSSHRTSGVPAIAAPAASAACHGCRQRPRSCPSPAWRPMPAPSRQAGATTASDWASASAAAPARRSEAGRSRSSASCRWTRRRSRSARSPMLEEPAVESEPARAEAGAAPRAAKEGRGGGRDRAGSGAEGGDDAEPAAPRAKRTRARAKKKAE